MGIPSWAVPGARVVCIAANGRWVRDGDRAVFDVAPRFGGVYRISRVSVEFDGVFLRLDDPALGGDEWDARWFRPAVDDATEAELFRALRPQQPSTAPHPDPLPSGEREKVGA